MRLGALKSARIYSRENERTSGRDKRTVGFRRGEWVGGSARRESDFERNRIREKRPNKQTTRSGPTKYATDAVNYCIVNTRNGARCFTNVFTYIWCTG